ncbi:unnamed protein product [Rhizoctonia solani]|uniref:Uncharacterized protein n=1 Tax=Rhizoctonia solani TaxID=456999 RepID=A0A8H2XU19_9AGAM|nr:unnamed protein product [Rhizoctonia solani]
MGNWKDGIFLKIANVLAYFVLLGSNVYIYTKSDGDYRSGKETYFTPAPYAFGIWPVIHLLWLGLLVYQFTENGTKTIVEVGWKFPAVAISSAVYIYVWAKGNYTLAFMFIYTASDWAVKLRKALNEHPSKGFHDGLWVRFLVSLFSGWVSILFVVVLFEAFGVASSEPAGTATKGFVILGMISLVCTAPADAFQEPGALGGSIAIAWGLFTIFEHQRSDAIVHWSALLFATVSLLSVLVNVARFGKRRGMLDDEERPLIAGN